MTQSLNFDALVELCRKTHEEMQGRAARSVDLSLVVRNWLFGWYIVEYEQSGADRAEIYGKRLIDRLSKSLKGSGLRGISPTNLRKFREFYAAYPEIQQTLSAKSLSSRNLKYTSYFAKECPCLQIGQQPAAQLPCGEMDRVSQALTQRLKLYRVFYQQCRRISPTLSDQLAMVPPLKDQPEIRPTASDESRSIGSMVRGFKIGVTKWYRKRSDTSQIWQRNYWEHIIRNEPELNRIRRYIVDNPMQWEQDSLRNPPGDAQNHVRESRPVYGPEAWMV